jgi:hypothetical protein
MRSSLTRNDQRDKRDLMEIALAIQAIIILALIQKFVLS